MVGSFRRRRSGGPQTQEGKALAAQNSLKTGAYATAIVMPGEAEAEFLELRDALLAELAAVGVLEANLVHELAAIIWRKARIDRLEHRAVLQSLSVPVTTDEYFAAGLERTPDNERAVMHLSWLDSDFASKVDMQETLACQLMAPTSSAHALETIKVDHPVLYERLVGWAQDDQDEALWRGMDLSMQLKFHNYAKRSGNYDELIKTLGKPLGARLLQECQDFRQVQTILPRLKALRERIHEQRLAHLMLSEGSARAREDLNRAFFRILKELRIQQEWRRKNDVVDVTPIPKFSKTD